MASFSFRPAQRSNTVPLIGFYAQSGCGKTYSSLLLARGLVGPKGKIAMIDTESGRGSLYADVIPGGYDILRLDAPFSARRYREAIAVASKHDCLIIDSASHEWEGVGGVIDQAAQIEERTKKPGLHCWKTPKLEHQLMMLAILQSSIPIICCLRAKFKSRQAKNPQTGKTEILRDEHTSPIQDDAFIFEMTVHAEILQDHKMRVTKTSHPQLASVFKTGQMVTVQTGESLNAWIVQDPRQEPNPPASTLADTSGSSVSPSREPDERPDQPRNEEGLGAPSIDADAVYAQLENACANGTGGLEDHWLALSKEARAAIGANRLDGLKAKAAEFDDLLAAGA